eukprot:223266_1
MWPHGGNCSFLIGISDYFQDIKRHQTSSLTDTDKTEVDIICNSLNKLISNKTGTSSTSKNRIATARGYEGTEGGDDDSCSAEAKIKKFFEWGQTYINITSSQKSVNWEQLVELFNFQFPHYEIPSDVDITTYHGTYLYKHCKEKGNECMKNKKPKQAIELYSKAIHLLEKAEKDPNKEAPQAEEDDEKKDKTQKNEIAIIYCNRSAAWVYLQEYQNAVNDAVLALKYDPLLTKAWIRKGMAEQELERFQIAYGDYQVALNQSKQTDNYYKFLIKKIKQCFDQIVMQHTKANAPAND